MKARNKKGISSIVGALIFLQILAISLILVIHVINEETNTTQKSIQTFQSLAENAPIEEMTQHGITYLYSPSPFEITHVIYPNGEIINTSITVNNEYPASKILGSSPWAIIVTNKGTYYNVTYLGGASKNPTHITFPSYQDYGSPLDPSVLNVTQYPNWGVLDGIAFPSAISLTPVNVTIGDPTTYSWAITDAELAVYPNSSTGWINITYYQPIHYDHWEPEGVANIINATLGIYVPTNVTSTYTSLEPTGQGQLVPGNKYWQASTIQYTYIYVSDNENGIDSCYNFYAQVGTLEAEWYYFASYHLCYLPAYDLSSDGIINTEIYFPPINIYNTSMTNYQSLGWNSVAFGGPPQNNWFDSNNIVNITVYQVDINLNKGEVLNYGYYNYNNSWVLLGKWAFGYNNPQMYLKAYDLTCEVFSLGYYTFAYLSNIDNVQYQTNYPVYIVVPQGTYLLQVNLS